MLLKTLLSVLLDSFIYETLVTVANYSVLPVNLHVVMSPVKLAVKKNIIPSLNMFP